ncbi:hypothetical protein [Leptolyngbya ohadii]|uniref:hypothetical protein n=1 Tax=Leptolyngbya ohadii TaxID=1962290 RepID=UPI00117B529C|nr:hypothetical protein [Leptolyngbya ohadii]
MSPSAIDNAKESSILGKFAGVVGLLGAALFFTGWIYRWAYFGYFQLDIMSLSFPFHSFLIVPIQVFLADSASILRTVLLLLGMTLTIYITLLLLRNLEIPTEQRFETPQPPYRSSPSSGFGRQHSRRLKLCGWLVQFRQWLLRGNPLRRSSFRLLESFVNDVVVVAWILVFLFFYAQWRGTMDAQRDAYQCRSRLPAVTLVMPIKNSPIARNFQSLGTVTELTRLDTVPGEGREEQGEFGIIGDVEMFDEVRQEIINSPKLSPPRVWRLLLEANSWIYLFPTLALDPTTASEEIHPPVLAIRASYGDQLMILRPEEIGAGCAQ